MKIIFNISCLTLFVCLFVLTNCRKIEQELPESTANNLTNYQTIMVRIDGYRELMQSTYKSGGSIPIDSAIWNLEALITFDEAYPDSGSIDFTIRTVEFNLSVDQNNEVLESDAQNLYNDILDTIAWQLDQFTEEVKFLLFSDVELIENMNGLALLKVNNGYGLNSYHDYIPFNEEDDWIWGTHDEGEFPPAGQCDGDFYGISDGSNELEVRLNNPDPYDPHLSKHGVLTDITIVDLFYQTCFYNEPPHLPRVFSTTSATECMYNEDLQFYLEAGDWIIYDYNATENDSENVVFIFDGEGARPEGKDFVSIEITDEFDWSNSKWYHYYKITYGIYTEVEGDPS